MDQHAVKYPYDSARAMQLIEGLGYPKGSDSVYRDPMELAAMRQ